MKLAVFFRGALRPNPDACNIKMMNIINELKNAGHDVTTWLVTWRHYKDYNTASYVIDDLFDNVVLVKPPSDEYISKFTNKLVWRNMFYTFYHARLATKLIIDSGDYDYIVNTRPDLIMSFGSHLDSWFNPTSYSSPWTPVDWINDFIGIAPPDLMFKSWDYGTRVKLGEMMDQAEIPEHIQMRLQQEAGISTTMCQFNSCVLDATRHS